MGKYLPYVVGIILTVIFLWLLLTPIQSIRNFIERLDNMGYDLQLRAHILANRTPKLGPIFIVDIDDKSLEKEGRWPWPRQKVASLTQKIHDKGALAISFDMFFSELQPNIAATLLNKLTHTSYLRPTCITDISKAMPLFDEDAQFIKSLSDSKTILALAFLKTKQIENSLPPPLITLSPVENKQLNFHTALGYIANVPAIQQAASGSGFINVEPDSDGIARRAMLTMRYGNSLYPSLVIQTVMSLFGDKFSLITKKYFSTIKLEGIQLGNTRITTDERGQVLIPFVGRSHTFPSVSATDVLNDNIADEAFFGKIVIVGTSALGLGDFHATAIQNLYAGVEIQATLLNGLLQNNFSYIPAWTQGVNLVFIILFGLLATLIFPHLGPRLLTLAIILIPIFTLLINNWIWTRTGFIFSSFLPVILLILIAFFNIIYGYTFETRKREKLKNIFGQYVPEKHIDEMLNSKDALGLYGEDREMTVLFADIRNFTTLSEQMSASKLVEILNAFFTPMTEIIFKHRGTIDKYIGDMLMAFWGAPLRDKNHATHALESALEMQTQIKTMREYWEKQNLPQLKIGIGINSGPMSVGDMGSRFRRNYTVLGDAVNLASRIESLTKVYGVDIIVGENTQANHPKFVFRLLDKVKVKGKEVSTNIYELIGRKKDLSQAMAESLELFHQALHAYFSQEWQDAEVKFLKLLEMEPNKKLYMLYLNRIKEYIVEPPPPDWDGVHTHLAKN